MRLNIEWMRTRSGMVMMCMLFILIGMQIGFRLCPMMVTCITQQYAIPPGVEFNLTNNLTNTTAP